MITFHAGWSHQAHIACDIRSLSLTRGSLTLQQKEKAIDAYMDKKIQAKATTDQNIASLQQKLQELSRHLSSGDAYQVMARSSYYLQHMAGLVSQKALMEESGDIEAAEVAFQADREKVSQSAIELVIKYMCSSLRSTQGPNARVGAVRQYRCAVETALAFPKPQEWSYQLDSFTQQQFNGAQLQAPGGSAKRAADHFNAVQLQNAAQLHQVNKIADQYFYDRIMTSWNVGANHMIRAILKTSCRPCYLCCTMLQSSNKCQLRLPSASKLWQFRDKRSWRRSKLSRQLPGAGRRM